MIVVNLFGGPGVGKSSLAAYLFFLLKSEGINCELVTEYVKGRIWANDGAVPDDQLYCFAKQNNRLRRLRGKVDVAVTDSPLLLSCVYGKSLGEGFQGLVREVFGGYENLNYYIQRNVPYSSHGRYQTEDEARIVDDEVQRVLGGLYEYESVSGSAPDDAEMILSAIMERLNGGSGS